MAEYVSKYTGAEIDEYLSRAKNMTGLEISGKYNTLNELKAAHPNGNKGDAYMVGTDVYIWDIDEKEWKNVGKIGGTGLPDGGTAGQILMKDADGGASWENITGQEIALPLADGITTSGNCVYCKTADGMVTVNVAAKVADKSQAKVIATLPPGFRPSGQTFAAAAFYDNQKGFDSGRLMVDHVGTVSYNKISVFGGSATMAIVYASIIYKAVN